MDAYEQVFSAANSLAFTPEGDKKEELTDQLFDRQIPLLMDVLE